MITVDYDESVSEMIDGTPTAKDQEDITLTDEQLAKFENEPKP